MPLLSLPLSRSRSSPSARLSLYPFSPLDLATEYVRHAFSVESLYPFLSLHPIRRSSRSIPRFRNPYLSHSIASSVSLPRLFFSIAFDRVYVSLTRLPPFFSLTQHTYTHFLFLSLFLLLSLSLPLSACLSRPSRSRLWVAKFGRIRGDVPVPSTPCAVCRSVSEGSVRRFHGEAPFSTKRCGASPLSRSHARRNTRSLSLRSAISVSTSLRREYSRV